METASRRRPHRRPPRPRQGLLPRTSATAAASSSSMPARTCSARRPSRCWSTLILGALGAEGTAMAGPGAAASSRWRSTTAPKPRPPPEKWPRGHRSFRCCELDLIAEPSRCIFGVRARNVSEIRRWLDEHGTLRLRRRSCSRSTAAPWRYLHHAPHASTATHLRIATELYLKRLIVGGTSDGVYELGKDFRRRLAQAQPRSSRCLSGTRLRRLREDRARPRAAGLRAGPGDAPGLTGRGRD